MTGPRPEPDPATIDTTAADDRRRRASVVLAGAAAAIGVVELVAWLLGLDAVLTLAGDTPMKANTALAVIVVGGALVASRRGAILLTRAGGFVVALLGLATLAEHATGVSFGVDELLVQDRLARSGEPPGRMAANTAACLAVFGTALVTWRPDRRLASRAMAVASIASGSIGGVALFGYLAGLPAAYGWGRSIAMAPPTVLGVLLLSGSFGLAAATTRQDRQRPLTEVVTLAIGLFSLTTTGLVWHAVSQQITREGHLDGSSASRAILVVATSSAVMLTSAAWFGQRADARRREAVRLARLLQDEVHLRRRAEMQASKDRLLLEKVLDVLPVGVHIVRPDGSPARTNRAADGILGPAITTIDDVRQLPDAYDLVQTPSMRPYPWAELPVSHAFDGRPAHADDVIVRRQGRDQHLEVWAAPLHDGGRVELVVTAFTDITERRAAERDVADKADLLDLADDAIFIRDAQHRITYWNLAAERRYGWSAAEAVGQDSIALLAAVLPAPLCEIEAELAADGHWEGRIEHVARDGRQVVCDTRWAARRDANGAVTSVMCLNTDVTVREQAQAEIAARRDELEGLRLELERSNADLEQFAYAASHDLSEPLRAISGPISLLEQKYAGQLDVEADKLIDFAVDGCRRMQQLIDDLLALSRVGRFEGDRLPVDTAVMASTVFALAADDLGVVPDVRFGMLPVVLAEPSQLRQVFENLIGNAVKFHRPGVPPVIEVDCRPDGAALRFTVADNGIGIDPRYRERVFGMFKRLHTRDVYPGTGIGLALCKKIVERHGGRIGVSDGPGGVGSTFWFTLPTESELVDDFIAAPTLVP